MNPSEKPPVPDGWNDPPANLSLTENISTKRVILNKRVPYTNQNLSSTNSSTSSVLTAPPTSVTTPSLSDVATSSSQTTSLNEFSLTIDEINTIFKNQMTKLEESATVDKKILEDIGKKFQQMQDEWTQDKLSANTKQILVKIFQELDANQVQQAFDTHVSLVRQAGPEVVRFIVGIKRFIQELQKISK